MSAIRVPRREENDGILEVLHWKKQWLEHSKFVKRHKPANKESERNQNRIFFSRYIIIKCLEAKNKEKNLKINEKERTPYVDGKTIQRITDSPHDNSGQQLAVQHFQVIKDTCEPQFCLAKSTFRNEEVKTFANEGRVTL